MKFFMKCTLTDPKIYT